LKIESITGMSFLPLIDKYKNFDFTAYCNSVTKDKVKSVLAKQFLSEMDYLALLSDSASELLEDMAQRAHTLTQQHFGNVIFLFTPLYISNVCDNVCAYCSFAKQHHIHRRHLNFEEIRQEAENIAKKGIRHILVLTGESRRAVSIEYLEKAISIIKEYFSTVAIEIYALDENEYKTLVNAGVDGLTIYQETYNRDTYKILHTGGPKADYEFRLDAPDRACKSGVRAVTVGALFGLHEWRSEAFFTGLHAAHLQNRYTSAEVSVSFPRIRPLAGEFTTEHVLGDRQFVQLMTALRIYMPSAGITVSTRESESFRNSILPLGPTKMSAGVSTAVGGHSEDPSTSQFEISDTRSVEQMKADLVKRGFQPVMHDWNRNYVS
jgi:2-iminoacetate synthase